MKVTSTQMLRCFTLLAIFLMLAQATRAQEENIYLIKMFECVHQPAQRSQTGFRVRGLKGIVTALHGVADCRRMTVRSRKDPILDQPLNVVKADVDRDTVLLSSPQLDQADRGLEPAVISAWETLGTVKAYGHPYGIGRLETTLSLRNPPLERLKDLIPPAQLSELIKRQSPNHLIRVLNLQGNLLPGHSGAPILDATGRVVAIANGGLKGGFSAISWAVPFQDVEWGEVESRLKDLSRIDPNILFASDAAPTESILGQGDDFCSRISELVAAGKTGFFPIIGDPVSDRAINRFRPKMELPGATSGVIEPHQHVTYGLYESDTIGRIESQYYNLIAKLSNCLPGWKQKENLPPAPALSANPEGRRVLQPVRYRRHLFREKSEGATVEIYYVLGGSTSAHSRTLWLSVYAPGKGNW